MSKLFLKAYLNPVWTAPPIPRLTGKLICGILFSCKMVLVLSMEQSLIKTGSIIKSKGSCIFIHLTFVYKPINKE